MRSRLTEPKVAVSVVFVLAIFISIMDVTIVNVALPQLGRDLHVGASGVAAVAIGYLVSLAVVIPASGWLGDRFGGKRILLIAIVIFTRASALFWLAQTFGELAKRWASPSRTTSSRPKPLHSPVSPQPTPVGRPPGSTPCASSAEPLVSLCSRQSSPPSA